MPFATLPRVTPTYTPTNTFGTGTYYYPANAAALSTLLAGGTLTASRVIVLTDGVCYNDATYRTQTFPVVAGASGANPVWVVTSNVSRLPAPGNGVRSLTGLVTLSLPHFRMFSGNEACVQVMPRASGWRFVGLEIDAGAVTTTYGVVHLGTTTFGAWQSLAPYSLDIIVGDGSVGQKYICILAHTGIATSPASDPTRWRLLAATDMPTGIICDRVLVTASDHANNSHTTVTMNTREMALMGSCFWSEGVPGAEDHALASVEGAGPWLIDNCQLSASGENILTGGDVPAFDSLPRDVTFTRNWCYKPLRWCAVNPAWDGKARIEKNLFELKVGEYWLIEKNIFENHWDGGTSQYYAIVLKVSNGADSGGVGYYANASTAHITFRNNVLKNVGGIFDIGARDNYTGNPAATPAAMHHIDISQCYTDGLAGNLSAAGASSQQFQLNESTTFFSAEHLTLVSDIATKGVRFVSVPNDLPAVPASNWIMRNIIADFGGEYGGLWRDSYGQYGNDAFAGTASSADGMYIYDPVPWHYASKYPSPKWTMPTSPATTLVDRAGGNFRTATALTNAGYNGETPGAYIDTIIGLTTGVVSGVFAGNGILTGLVIVTAAAGAIGSLPLTTQPVIRAVDTNGNTVTSFTGPVTVYIRVGRSRLRGTLTVNAVAGVATFTDLVLTGRYVNDLGYSTPSI